MVRFKLAEIAYPNDKINISTLNYINDEYS